MATPAELLSNLERAFAEVEKAKKAVLTLSRDSAESVNALYRTALFMLHEQHDLEGAKAVFSKLAVCTVDCEARAQARVTYGLMLWAGGKFDDAINMLKRVVSEDSEMPLKALALDYLSTFMREQNASKPAIAKIDEQRIEVLQSLVSAEADKKLKADYQLRLEAALKERES
jgi:tetratricopeptide (TPR) repeat protein